MIEVNTNILKEYSFEYNSVLTSEKKGKVQNYYCGYAEVLLSIKYSLSPVGGEWASNKTWIERWVFRIS
jgi:hypothetical protein